MLFKMKSRCEKEIIIAGHRGNPECYPENTLKSFLSAIEIGVDMIETDIHMTSDGVLVLIHDHDLKRTTDGEGFVRDMTFEKLKSFNAGTESEFMFIPTLEELLKEVQKVDGLMLNLEIKVYLNDEGEKRVAEAVDKTVELCEKYKLDGRIMFNCFDAYVLEYIYKKYGKRFVLHGYYPFDILKNKSLNPLEYLDYACYWAVGEKAKECCDYLLANKIEPCTGSSTSEEVFYEAAGFGCSMFTENDPLSALNMRKNFKVR